VTPPHELAFFSAVSRLKQEIGLAGKYGLAGVANTIVGLSVILALTAAGMAPMLANAIGFAVGLLLAFTLSRRFVFRSDGHVRTEVGRFLFFFAISYAINLAVLNLAIGVLGMQKLLAQVVANASYTLSMFLFSRLFVFRLRRG
jgi:putative flippase GtrA